MIDIDNCDYITLVEFIISADYMSIFILLNLKL